MRCLPFSFSSLVLWEREMLASMIGAALFIKAVGGEGSCLLLSFVARRSWHRISLSFFWEAFLREESTI